jgi:DNA adenine methylase
MDTAPRARPFLKWAGGKTQLLAPIAARLPATITRAYLEPFLGSGAVFFHLAAAGRLQGPVQLSDANPALVEAFQAVQRAVEPLIDLLAEHRARHHADPRAHYHAVRDAAPRDPVERAARLLYLNKTCYNGLWRVNRSGKFNVPMGRYARPSILDADNLRAASAALARATVRCEPFERALARARRGAVAYLDPPYEPLSATSSFTAYTAAGFGREDQERLADACAGLVARGGAFLLSNSDHRFLRGLYRARGFRVEAVDARRAINSAAGKRGPVRELLVTPGAAP